ncbi:MAG: hypothetical protein JRJ69_14855 [Deltaproteobacteria bacterium]|nr:hypothetical protein [Deltaproteobacteria bacterium]
MKQTDHFLDRFFNPESVAIVGATNNPFKMNFRILENLVNLNFKEDRSGCYGCSGIKDHGYCEGM